MAEETAFDIDDMKEIVEDFLVEADELVSTLDSDLVKLERSSSDPDLLNSIFRAAHTIKGTSSFLGLDQITELTHKMEDILNKLRKSELMVTPEIMDVLLASLDILKTLLENVREEKSESMNLDEIFLRLNQALSTEILPDSGELSKPKTAKQKNKSQSSASNQPNDTNPQTVSVPTEEKVPTQAKIVGAVPDAEKKHSTNQTIRVDVDRLDTLMNLMGEMVLGRNSLIQTVNKLTVDGSVEDGIEQLNQVAASVSYITTELQMAVMKMRMQPISRVFNKFPRLVRDLSRDSKKKIELRISGEHTELDRTVIEEIGDPLVHIIRNSCDHGIESPQERLAAGKPEQGVVELSADQEGSNIVIRISDDGKGLDVERIREKAVERGLISAQEAKTLPDKDIFRFIFEAGFSTAEKVTGVSGRGVGMDVVRTNIEKLNGLVEIESTPGVGTTMDIRLPLTLAIIQGLLVESEGDVFILPLSSVHETVKTEHSEINYIGRRPMLSLREDVIPIVNLNSILGKNGNRGLLLAEHPYIVIVGLAGKKLGILLDRFLGQEEVVIKTLGSFLGNTDGIAGATILGDGRIRLIIDLIGLFALTGKQQ